MHRKNVNKPMPARRATSGNKNILTGKQANQPSQFRNIRKKTNAIIIGSGI